MTPLAKTRLEKNRLEWIVFGISLVLVLATFGYLLREALTTSEVPPDIFVSLGEASTGSGGFMVPVEAANRGGRAAEDVRITVTLETPDGGYHESIVIIPYLPRESKRQGWVTFPTDPRTGTLRVDGVGFQSP